MSRFQGTHTGGVRFPATVNAALRITPFLTAILAILIVLSAAACATEPPTLEERAQSIDQRLMCPVCPAETIDQSQADVAIQMRELVREKLRPGNPKTRYSISSSTVMTRESLPSLPQKVLISSFGLSHPWPSF